jgi:endonuclease YncB( thermonuclease family)
VIKNRKLLSKTNTQALLAWFLLLLWSALAGAATPGAQVWSGVVSYVVDGDTVWVRPDGGGKPLSIRVDGIDAPEICQPGGAAARDALKHRALGQRVTVHGRLDDAYGRQLARLVLDGDDLGEWLVTQGLAWSYRYRNDAGPYLRQQSQAEAARLGLFSPRGPRPVYPRVFRKQHGRCY